jgi:hypothetical protein
MHWEWPSLWHLARTSGGALTESDGDAGLNFQERSASCQLQDVKVQAKMSPGEKVLQTE